MLEVGAAPIHECYSRRRAGFAWLVVVDELLSLACDVKYPKVLKLVVYVVVVGAAIVMNLLYQYPICFG